MIRINVLTKKLIACGYLRRWRALNLERSRALNRKWIAANLDKHKQAQKLWYLAHADQENTRSKLWAKNNPDRKYARTHKRRARIYGAGGSYTVEEWIVLKQQYGRRCLACGCNETELALLGRKLVPDHVLAIANGGTNSIDNIQPLCHGKKGCNNRKHTRFIDYREQRAASAGSV